MCNDIPIFSFETAKDLLEQGFYVVNICQNTRFTDKIVFYFKRSDEITRYLKEEHGIIIK